MPKCIPYMPTSPSHPTLHELLNKEMHHKSRAKKTEGTLHVKWHLFSLRQHNIDPRQEISAELGDQGFLLTTSHPAGIFTGRLQ